MGDFKAAFKEGLGESLAYGTAALIFLLLIGLLIGVGVYNNPVDLEGLIGRGIIRFARLRGGSRF